MSDDIELVNAGEYLNKLCADMSASKSYYYDIQYTLSTTLLEYRLKHSLTSKDMASYLEVSPSMLSNYESGDYIEQTVLKDCYFNTKGRYIKVKGKRVHI